MTGLRVWARRFPRLRSLHYLLATLRTYRIETPAEVSNELESQYSSGTDPWAYLTKANELERYEMTLQTLDRWRADRRPTAFEVGCGEGHFTKRLAERCASVLAVDMIDLACERTRAACKGEPNVTVCKWDAVAQGPPDLFDLVVCMDVMVVGWRPFAQRRAMRSVAGSVGPRGGLLITAVLASPVIERARWARWLGRGAHGIVHRFSSVDRRLVLRDMKTTSSHVIALYEAS